MNMMAWSVRALTNSMGHPRKLLLNIFIKHVINKLLSYIILVEAFVTVFDAAIRRVTNVKLDRESVGK